MTIRDLKEVLDKTENISLIGKDVTINGADMSILGTLLFDSRLVVYCILHSESCDNAISADFEDQPALVTHRHILQNYTDFSDTTPLHNAKSIVLGGKTYNIESSTFAPLLADFDANNAESFAEGLIPLSKFLDHGWDMGSLADLDFSQLLFCVIELEGEFSQAPTFSPTDILEVNAGQWHKTHLLRQSFSLDFDHSIDKTLTFTDPDSQQEIVCHINKMYKHDVWCDFEKNFSSPDNFSGFSQSEIEKMKVGMYKAMATTCPQGMQLAVIEYECDADISLTFHSTQFLDHEIVGSSRCAEGVIGFTVGENAEIGPHGMRVQSCILQGAVSQCQQELEIELFSFSRLMPPQTYKF